MATFIHDRAAGSRGVSPSWTERLKVR